MFRLMTLSSLMLLFAVSAEVYHIPTEDFSQKNNGLSTPIEVGEQADVNAYWPRNIFLQKLLNYLQQQEMSNDTYTIEESNVIWPEMPVKVPGVKRWFSALNANMPAMLQRKWKIKKGKGPLICYFKLCSFKPLS